jgi:hypothetical protein
MESTAAFHAKVTTFGLGEFIPKMTDLGWTSFAVLAYVSEYVPGVSSTDSFDKELAIPLFGIAAHVKRPQLRRLFVTAFTMATEDLKQNIETTGSEEIARPMPKEEREDRRDNLDKRLSGLELEFEYDPSIRLVNLAHELFDLNHVRYIQWEDCTMRNQELDGQKKDKSWEPDPKGFVREHEVTVHKRADLGSDQLLRQALARRAIALDMAGLITFEASELWHNLLFRAYNESPEEGYKRVSLEQIRRADRKLFEHVNSLCRKGVRPLPDKTLPFEIAFKDGMQSLKINLCLAPRQGSDSTSSSGGGPHKKARHEGHGTSSVHKSDLDKILNSVKHLETAVQAGAHKGRGWGGGGGVS